MDGKVAIAILHKEPDKELGRGPRKKPRKEPHKEPHSKLIL